MPTKTLITLAMVLLTACAGVPSEHQTPEKLTFVTEDYPPFTYKNQDGEVTGIATEIVQAIMQKQGINEEIQLMPWNQAYHTALKNSNVVIFSLRQTAEREHLFHWVGPIVETKTILFAKKGSGIELADLEDAKQISSIGVVDEWFSAQELQDQGFENLVSSPLPTDVVDQIIDGTVLLAPFVDVTVEEIVAEAGYTMDDLEPVLTIGTGYNYIGLSQGTSAETVTQWKTDFAELKANGTMEKIYQKYKPGYIIDD